MISRVTRGLTLAAALLTVTMLGGCYTYPYNGYGYSPYGYYGGYGYYPGYIGTGLVVGGWGWGYRPGWGWGYGGGWRGGWRGGWGWHGGGGHGAIGGHGGVGFAGGFHR